MAIRFYENIGKRIREIREEAELTQAELATRADLNRRSIMNIEAGQKGVFAHTLQRIADALRVPIAAIWPGDDDED